MIRDRAAKVLRLTQMVVSIRLSNYFSAGLAAHACYLFAPGLCRRGSAGWRLPNRRLPNRRTPNRRPPCCGGSPISWPAVCWLRAPTSCTFGVVPATPLAYSSKEIRWYIMTERPYTSAGKGVYFELHSLMLGEVLIYLGIRTQTG